MTIGNASLQKSVAWALRLDQVLLALNAFSLLNVFSLNFYKIKRYSFEPPRIITGEERKFWSRSVVTSLETDGTSIKDFVLSIVT